MNSYNLDILGLDPHPHSPCIFKGEIIPGRPPLFLGLYVDDFIYFSTDDEVEKQFQTLLESKTNVDFMGPVSHFLGHKFQWDKYHKDNTDHLRVHLSQSAYVDHLLDIANLGPSSKLTMTTSRSGKPVDSIVESPVPPEQKANLQNQMRSMVGSLLWISQGTRPDMATITAMLSHYQNNPNPNHIEAARYAI